MEDLENNNMNNGYGESSDHDGYRETENVNVRAEESTSEAVEESTSEAVDGVHSEENRSGDENIGRAESFSGETGAQGSAYGNSSWNTYDFRENSNPRSDRAYDIPGYNGNGPAQDDGNTKKPKRHLAAKILIPIAIAAALGTSVWATVHQVQKIRERFRKDPVAEVQQQRVDETVKAEPETMPDKGGDRNPTTLNKNDALIDITDTSASTVCLDVSEVVENVMPSVVAITDNLEYTTSGAYNPYNFYFGGNSGSKTEERTASGSGVIIGLNDEELLIVTNNHVVDNAGNYTAYTITSKGLAVQFSDGSTASAVIKGTDSEADLAVIAVRLSEISDDTREAIRVAVVGDSDTIKVGSGVIAIGNALGYGQSVTTGIVSAKNREVTIDGITRTLLQTDAAINPGNSGGGLFNARGELIGINSAKTSDTSVEGMGFAIPITSAEEIIEDLMNQVTVAEADQGYLGIMGETVTATYVTRYGYPEGVSITRISEGSPAEKAGLQIYDIVTAVDGKKVTSMNELKKYVNRHPAGDTVTLTVSRPDGRNFKEMEIQVTLARYSEVSDGFIVPETDAELPPGEKEPQLPESEGDAPNDSEGNAPDGNEGGVPDMDSLFDWFFNNF